MFQLSCIVTQVNKGAPFLHLLAGGILGNMKHVLEYGGLVGKDPLINAAAREGCVGCAFPSLEDDVAVVVPDVGVHDNRYRIFRLPLHPWSFQRRWIHRKR